MKVILIIVLLFSVNLSVAQDYSKELAYADKEVGARRYQEALAVYKNVQSKKSHGKDLHLKIGQCYYELRNLENAAKWYTKALHDTVAFDQRSYANYLRTLFSLGDVDQIQKVMEISTKKGQSIRFLSHILKSMDDFESFMTDSLLFSVKTTSLNTQFSEICPVFYGQQLVYSSNAKLTVNLNVWSKSVDNQRYLDICVGELNSASPEIISNIKNYSKSLNTPYQDGPVCFYDEGGKMIYSRSLDTKVSNEIVPMGLFMAELDTQTNKWTNITPFPFNLPNHNITHPAISEDGKTLIFSSDKNGGFGRSDLYISQFISNKWTQPQNLGDKVNTSGNEVFPTIRDNTLYFSSNGHPGIGGLDIFQLSLDSYKESKPKNLGYPLNSRNDDFSIVFDEDGGQGYFASNRNGNDDIFYFKQKNRVVHLTVSGDPQAISEKSESIKFISDERVISLPYTQDATGYKIFVPVNKEVTIGVSRLAFETSIVKLEEGFVNESISISLKRIERNKVEVIAIPKVEHRHEIVIQFDDELLSFELEDSIWFKIKKNAGQLSMDSLLLSKNLNIDLRVQITKRLVEYSITDIDNFEYANQKFNTGDSVKINLISKLILKDPTVSLRMNTNAYAFDLENTIHQRGISRNNLITTESHKKGSGIGIMLDDRHILLTQTTLGDLSYKIMIGAFAIHRVQDFSYLKDLGPHQQYLSEKTGLTIFYLKADDYQLATDKKETSIKRGISDAVLYFYYKGEFKWVHQIIKIIKDKDKETVIQIRKDYNIYYKWYNEHANNKTAYLTAN
ncbi:MAG: hypothetical protein OCD76_16535 [Reichenbachiella sp.]